MSCCWGYLQGVRVFICLLFTLCHAPNANTGSSLLPGNAVPTVRSVLRQVVNHTHLLANLLCSWLAFLLELLVHVQDSCLSGIAVCPPNQQKSNQTWKLSSTCKSQRAKVLVLELCSQATLWSPSSSSLPTGPWMGRVILQAVKKYVVIYQFQTTYWKVHHFSKQLQNALRLFLISMSLYTENLWYFWLAQASSHTKHLWNHQNLHTHCLVFLFVLYCRLAFLLSLCLY